jgi:hypothetical protein
MTWLQCITRCGKACWLLCDLIVLMCVPAAAGVSYFSCPHVAYFAGPCTVTIPTERLELSNEAPDDTPAPPGADEPLFTPDTVSPDTPPLFLQLLLEPTETNARAYYLWQLKRMVRTKQVQAMLQAMLQAAPEDPEIRYWLEQLRAPTGRAQLDPAAVATPPARTAPVPNRQVPPVPLPRAGHASPGVGANQGQP